MVEAKALLRVEGNPLENISLIDDPAANFKVINEADLLLERWRRRFGRAAARGSQIAENKECFIAAIS